MPRPVRAARWSKRSLIPASSLPARQPIPPPNRSREPSAVGSRASPANPAPGVRSAKSRAVPENCEDEARVVRQVTAPETPRLPQQAVEPLEPGSLHPARCLRQRPGMDVEGRADAEQDWRLEPNDMLRHPALLLGRTEADPHEVRFRAIDQLDDALVLLPRQGPKGRRVRSRHGQVREAPT